MPEMALEAIVSTMQVENKELCIIHVYISRKLEYNMVK
jgi:hypothetical protein